MTQTIKQRVKNLLEQMTLDEKLAQMGSHWMYELQTKGELDMEKVKGYFKHGMGQVTRLAGASTLDPVNVAKTANILQKFLIENTRLGIPAIIHEECCSGATMLGGSTYPQIIGLASTFRPELAQKMTEEIRLQLRAIGAHQGLAPVLDIGRDPRWGRIEETFGEDPLLISQFGIRYIRGLQGESLTNGIMATGKHFVGHSFSQSGLNCGPVHIGMRELWDVCLMPFQAAIKKAGLVVMMNTYPELDSEVVASSRRFLTELLREKLGFDGLVVSDYEAILMLHTFHHTAPDKTTAAAMALEAGIDVETPTIQCYGDDLRAALENNAISMEYVDTAVSRHLEKKFELGLFENPYVDDGRVQEVFESPAQRTLAGDIARQSMVLLSNNGTLPLKKNIRSLAVIGPNADNSRALLGGYSYAAMLSLMIYNKPADSAFLGLDTSTLAPHQIKVPSILDAIRAKMPQAVINYAKGCENMSDDKSGFDAAVAAAEKSDAAILILGDVSGLTPDCTCGETRDSADLRLPGVQTELANAILATAKPVVIVLVNGRPLAIPDLAEKAAAILEAWLPGEEGGAAVADVLFGDANPGGKLPITFPRSAGQLPIFYSHKPSGGRSHWYIDYVSESVKPLYPFGHGLSYTQFEYGDLSISSKQAARGETVNVAFNVKNTGDVIGDEVVQFYTCDVYASSPRPVKELKGFARLTLAPGETRRVTFKLPVDLLAFYNNDLELVVEPGQINVMIGSSSQDIRLTGEFEISGAGKTAVPERIFECPVEIS